MSETESSQGLHVGQTMAPVRIDPQRFSPPKSPCGRARRGAAGAGRAASRPRPEPTRDTDAASAAGPRRPLLPPGPRPARGLPRPPSPGRGLQDTAPRPPRGPQARRPQTAPRAPLGPAPLAARPGGPARPGPPPPHSPASAPPPHLFEFIVGGAGRHAQDVVELRVGHVGHGGAAAGPSGAGRAEGGAGRAETGGRTRTRTGRDVTAHALRHRAATREARGPAPAAPLTQFRRGAAGGAVRGGREGTGGAAGPDRGSSSAPAAASSAVPLGTTQRQRAWRRPLRSSSPTHD